MTNTLKFVGDEVLIPADQLYCCVLVPSGQVVARCFYQYESEGVAKGWNNMRVDDEDTAESMTAEEWRKRFSNH